MKKIILLLLLVFPLAVMSQTEIVFEKCSWAELKAKSKTAGKPIFVDCYTEWCGPCKMMANKVFKEAAVAEYFNANFVNYKLDMEKGEGPEINKLYNIRSFPTFLFLDHNGTILNVIVGGMSGTEFLAKTKEGFSERGFYKMQQRYNKGDRTPEFMMEYIEVLDEARLKTELITIVPECLAAVSKEKLREKKYWDLFFKYVKSVDDPIFLHIYNNRDEFRTLYGESDVNKKLSWVWTSGACSYAKKIDDKATFDKKGFDNYIKRMKKADVENRNEIEIFAEICNADIMGDYAECAKLIGKRVTDTKMLPLDEVSLYNWICVLKKNTDDPTIRANMITWLEAAIANIDNGDAVRYADPLVQGNPIDVSMAAMLRKTYKSVFEKQIEEFSK